MRKQIAGKMETEKKRERRAHGTGRRANQNEKSSESVCFLMWVVSAFIVSCSHRIFDDGGIFKKMQQNELSTFGSRFQRFDFTFSFSHISLLHRFFLSFCSSGLCAFFFRHLNFVWNEHFCSICPYFNRFDIIFCFSLSFSKHVWILLTYNFTASWSGVSLLCLFVLFYFRLCVLQW